MAAFVDFWRIVTPASRKASYEPKSQVLDDAYNLNVAGYAGFSSMSWFSNLLKGATSRMQRYKQYEQMDRDDVARALDIMAEEISNPDKRTGLPFTIEYQTEDNQDIADNVMTTIRAALRHWAKLHGLKTKMFKIARTMVKYGDCFFRKRSDTKTWEYIDPTRVIGIEVTPEGEKVAYHVRPSAFTANGRVLSDQTVEIIPTAAMLHFTLGDEMGENQPFGMSVLQPVFNVWQKITMLEDSIIIYRIVRAPERRVFYVDVGNIPPQRVKQYLEQIRNDIRQKRIPNTQNMNQTDSQYNPESIQEDYFFPVTATGRGSRVETLPGGAEDFGTVTLKTFTDKLFRGLRVPTSYMVGQDAQGAQYSDGKVGIAYIEELRFANFIIRLQAALEEVLDQEFKVYLQVAGINLDYDIFTLELPEPQNFALYRQAALDADLINSFNSIEGVKYLSRRFILKRYLGLTDDDIQLNEAMIKEERSINDTALGEEGEVADIQQIYDPAVYENRKEITVSEPEPEAPPPEEGLPPEETPPPEEEPAPEAPSKGPKPAAAARPAGAP